MLSPVLLLLLLSVYEVLGGGRVHHSSRAAAAPSWNSFWPNFQAPRWDVSRGNHMAHRSTSLHFRAGQDVTLHCQIKGHWMHHHWKMGSAWNMNGVPARTVNTLWKKNGSPLRAESPGVTGSGHRFVIPAATLKDSGLYSCHEGSETGMANVFIHPRITLPDVQVTPRFINITEGTSIVLQCHPSGVTDPVIVWNLKERLFSDRVMVHGNRLWIRNAITADSGMYVCIVSNREGVYHEARSTVVVQKGHGGPNKGVDGTGAGPSLIALHPESFNGSVGSTIVLNCHLSPAIANANYNVQWSRHDGEIPSSRATYAKGIQELIINNAQENDSGVYSCIVLLEGGRYYEALSEVTIVKGVKDIRTDPSLIGIDPEFFNGPVGCTVILKCNFIAGVDSSVEWTRNRGDIPPKATYSKGNRALIIIDAQVDDSGVYSCIVRHESGEYYIQASSEVGIMPDGVDGTGAGPSLIALHPESFNGSVGSTLVLNCHLSPAIANANYNVQWSRHDGEIPSSRATYAKGIQELIINNAQENDSGVYSCIVLLEGGRYYEALSEVTIVKGVKDIRTDPSLIGIDPEFFNGPVGCTVILKCNFIAGVDSSVEWTRNRGDIPPKATYSKGNRALIIIDAQVDDSGVYSCIVRHESGEYYIQASSEVGIMPDDVMEPRTMTHSIWITPEQNEYSVGSTIHLKCNVDTSEESLLQWRKIGSEMPTKATYSEGKDEVIIAGAQLSDSGVYSCIYQHPNRNLQMEATMMVLIVPATKA